MSDTELSDEKEATEADSTNTTVLTLIPKQNEQHGGCASPKDSLEGLAQTRISKKISEILEHSKSWKIAESEIVTPEDLIIKNELELLSVLIVRKAAIKAEILLVTEKMKTYNKANKELEKFLGTSCS